MGKITTAISHRATMSKPTTDPILIVSYILKGLADGTEFSNIIRSFVRLLYGCDREYVFFEEVVFDFAKGGTVVDKFHKSVNKRLLPVLKKQAQISIVICAYLLFACRCQKVIVFVNTHSDPEWGGLHVMANLEGGYSASDVRKPQILLHNYSRLLCPVLFFHVPPQSSHSADSKTIGFSDALMRRDHCPR